jgi:hypothetical protein
LQQLPDQFRGREPHRIVALAFEAALKVLLFGQHAQQALPEFCRIVLGRAGKLLSIRSWRSAFARVGCRRTVGRDLLCGIARLSRRLRGCPWLFQCVRTRGIGSVF